MPGLAYGFRRRFAFLHTPERYYAHYAFVAALGLEKLRAYSRLKQVLAALPVYGELLDFGSGLGYGTAFLGARGVDLNEAVVTMARTRFPATRFDVADFDSLLASGARFKAVTCINVIEHFQDDFREKFLREAPRLLLPGGRLVIIYDNMYHPLQLLSGLLHPGMLLTDPTHIHCWTQGQFLKMLGKYLDVEHAEGVNILSRGLPYTNIFSTAGLYVCAPKR